jgi:hypothetical protein
VGNVLGEGLEARLTLATQLQIQMDAGFDFIPANGTLGIAS